MNRDKWVWMPHPGHFIGSQDCKFFLNTYIGGYIVSTVGEYLPDSQNGYKRVGCNRKYETMVFKAMKSKHKCCPYEMKNAEEIDFDGYNTAEDAFKGHYKMCKKWSAKEGRE